MLTVRPFRNEDPPRLLSLWTSSQRHGSRARLMPLSRNILEMQVLGQPFFDPRSIMLAVDEHQIVGYVHTAFGPGRDGSRLDRKKGQICFLCVDPMYPDPWGAARVLLAAAERYLTEQGAEEIYGGSPRPTAPFYLGFYGGGEPIAFFDSDRFIIQVFQEFGYRTVHKTTRLGLDLKTFDPPIGPAFLGWRSRLMLEFDENPRARTWWEACSLAHFDWLEVRAFLGRTQQPVARVRVRTVNPGADDDAPVCAAAWDAALTDVRVHPDFMKQGVASYTLSETLRHLIAGKNVSWIEAHIVDEMPSINSLLRSLGWREIETGTVFYKTTE